MKGEDRKVVLWIGGPPPDAFLRELDIRGGLRLVQTEERDLAGAVDSARAAVVQFRGDIPLFIAQARRTKDSIGPHGCFMGLARDPDASSLDYDSAARVVTRSIVTWFGPEARSAKPFDIFHTDWALLAQRIYDWQPGPSYRSETSVVGDDLAPDRMLLIRRAFWDFDKIELQRLSGGSSGSVVYQVIPRGPSKSSAHRSLPYLAKFDDPGRIAKEHDVYEKLVRSTVAFNHRPNIISGRTVYGPSSAVLVEDFMERALPMETMMYKSNASSLIASIFDGALQHWRRYPSLRREKLADHALFAKMLEPKPDSLKCLSAACSEAKKRWGKCCDGSELISTLRAVPPIECHWSNVHGDLHVGNLFVTAGSSDVVMIDFYRCCSGPTVIDPCCLEVDVLFRRSANLNTEFLIDLYSAPIGPIAPATCTDGCEWLWDCARSIRAIGGSTEASAYAFALAVFLLSFASYSDNRSDEHRALAAHLSFQLTERLS